jgi:hypothetical protein
LDSLLVETVQVILGIRKTKLNKSWVNCTDTDVQLFSSHTIQQGCEPGIWEWEMWCFILKNLTDEIGYEI